MFAYSIGHFANDLCAAMWFIYFSFYLLNVVQLSPNVAGLAILSGQITDGITTPVVGFLSDKIKCPLGKRNTWFYIGTVIVVPCFLCIFTAIEFFPTQAGENAWYITFPALFNVGWAMV